MPDPIKGGWFARHLQTLSTGEAPDNTAAPRDPNKAVPRALPAVVKQLVRGTVVRPSSGDLANAADWDAVNRNEQIQDVAKAAKVALELPLYSNPLTTLGMGAVKAAHGDVAAGATDAAFAGAGPALRAAASIPGVRQVGAAVGRAAGGLARAGGRVLDATIGADRSALGHYADDEVRNELAKTASRLNDFALEDQMYGRGKNPSMRSQDSEFEVETLRRYASELEQEAQTRGLGGGATTETQLAAAPQALPSALGSMSRGRLGSAQDVLNSESANFQHSAANTPLPRGLTLESHPAISDVHQVRNARGQVVADGLTPEQAHANGILRASGLEPNAPQPSAPGGSAVPLPEMYKRITGLVDGRVVRDHIPNQSSISASLTDYEHLPGVREVPLSAFTLDQAPLSKDPRVLGLAEEIRRSGELNPLIVAVDAEGPYILEGAHRYDALKILGAKSFPAQVVRDLSR